MTKEFAGFFKGPPCDIFSGAMANIRVHKESSEYISIKKMYTVFKVGRSRFYTLLNNGLSDTVLENKIIAEKIRIIQSKSKQTYGSHGVTQELQKLGIKVSRPRVARLVKKAK